MQSMHIKSARKNRFATKKVQKQNVQKPKHGQEITSPFWFMD